jgi:hypothetical protein
MQMLTLTREPVRLRTCSKYGTESARASITSSRNEPTAPLITVLVLELIELGRLCSSWMANGANSSAYLVMGVSTVAHNAIFVMI